MVRWLQTAIEARSGIVATSTAAALGDHVPRTQQPRLLVSLVDAIDA